MSYFISATASVLNLGTLAVERYLAIRNPHTYRNKLTGKRILVTIAGIWVTSLLLPLLYFEVGFITYAFIFANTALVAVFVITCLIYGLMLKKFHNRRSMYTGNNRDTLNYNSQLSLSTIQNSPVTPPRNRNNQIGNSLHQTQDLQSQLAQETIASTQTTNALYNSCQAMEQKITKMFLVVLIAMLLCYGPSTVFIYVMSFCETCSCKTLHWFRDLQFLFVIMNSSVNFFCYALRSPRFQNAFKYILRLKRPGDTSSEIRS
ncbi:5-hydroxytryptamine receptor 1A-like [Dendronephthya gigantea]|uniref:5-hydroxytryptamine receptor 1A-like n=1 Tax=Dendronephthya gigantea TaxID=151771 RepID=UPI00106983B3|nr:5-hydroxytryptamine receptor 1A-like [Dendronephthya gigantea]